jgi:hypothetical protein
MSKSTDICPRISCLTATNVRRDEQVTISFNGGKDCKCDSLSGTFLALIERKKARCSCIFWLLQDREDIEDEQIEERNAILMASMAVRMRKEPSTTLSEIRLHYVLLAVRCRGGICIRNEGCLQPGLVPDVARRGTYERGALDLPASRPGRVKAILMGTRRDDPHGSECSIPDMTFSFHY